MRFWWIRTQSIVTGDFSLAGRLLLHRLIKRLNLCLLKNRGFCNIIQFEENSMNFLGQFARAVWMNSFSVLCCQMWYFFIKCSPFFLLYWCALERRDLFFTIISCKTFQIDHTLFIFVGFLLFLLWIYSWTLSDLSLYIYINSILFHVERPNYIVFYCKATFSNHDWKIKSHFQLIYAWIHHFCLCVYK